MKRAAFLVITLFACLPMSALADCQAIVERTVAELRAAYSDWDERMETLARTAAGSACVKAGSPGVSAAAPGKAQPSAMSSTAVATAAEDDSGESEEKSADAESAAEKDEDDSWHPFKDIKFNEVSARPGKKPYERRREVNDPE